MPEKSEKFTFTNGRGQELAGRLEFPGIAVRATALFAHCFTCSKDQAAASRISRELRRRGFAVLRFDFTGLGNSEGDFGNTNFSSNVADLIAAADALREKMSAPALLIGHSLGGAAVLAAAGEIEGVQAVVTIAAPSDVTHVEQFLQDSLEDIEEKGEAEVELAGRSFTIRKQFVEDIREHKLTRKIEKLRKPLLLFHSPQDTVVGIDHARKIFEAAFHPKSFVSLDGADHVLSNKRDSRYVAEVIAAWAGRYIEESEASDEPRVDIGNDQVFVRSRGEKFAQDVFTGQGHRLIGDEPEKMGGENLGPDPYALLLAGLGSCTNMTVQMYARRKAWPLESVSTRLRHHKVHAEDCEDCRTKEGKIDTIERVIELDGELSEEQRERLFEIANKCPVHKTLSSEIRIRSRRADVE